MSVSMMVENPASESEGKIYVPVCAQEVFSQTIFPIAERLGLDLIVNWGVAVYVALSDFDRLKAQLKLLRGELKIRGKMHIVDRLDNLENKMQELFPSNPDIILTIG